MATVEKSASGQLKASESDTVEYTKRGPIAVITLNRPHVANAQDHEMLYALDAAFRRATHDDEVGCIILAGSGKHFSSGHDIKGGPGSVTSDSYVFRTPWYAPTDKAPVEAGYAREQEIYLGLCRQWREIPKPTIAVVQGACIAGGLMLAWVCDLIVASDDAYFSDPVVAMGVPGVEYFAHPFEMPNRIAREFLMLGERMSAQRAYEVGMVNRVVANEQVMDEAMSLASRLAQRPRFALALTKQAFNLAEDAMGKRTVNDGVFGLHHLAHAYNYTVHGSSVAVRDPKDIKKAVGSD